MSKRGFKVKDTDLLKVVKENNRNKFVVGLTLKAPITTAADDKFATFFPIFDKNKV